MYVVKARPNSAINPHFLTYALRKSIFLRKAL